MYPEATVVLSANELIKLREENLQKIELKKQQEQQIAVNKYKERIFEEFSSAISSYGNGTRDSIYIDDINLKHMIFNNYYNNTLYYTGLNLNKLDPVLKSIIKDLIFVNPDYKFVKLELMNTVRAKLHFSIKTNEQEEEKGCIIN